MSAPAAAKKRAPAVTPAAGAAADASAKALAAALAAFRLDGSSARFQVLRGQGNNFFNAKEYAASIDCFTAGFMAGDILALGNRSQAYLSDQKFKECLKDVTQWLHLYNAKDSSYNWAVVNPDHRVKQLNRRCWATWSWAEQEWTSITQSTIEYERLIKLPRFQEVLTLYRTCAQACLAVVDQGGTTEAVGSCLSGLEMVFVCYQRLVSHGAMASDALLPEILGLVAHHHRCTLCWKVNMQQGAVKKLIWSHVFAESVLNICRARR
jgi:hypothetical protein